MAKSWLKVYFFLVILMVFHREILPDLMNNFLQYTRAPACQESLSYRKKGDKNTYLVASITLHAKYIGARLIEYIEYIIINYYNLLVNKRAQHIEKQI